MTGAGTEPPQPCEGWVADELRAEHPDLGLVSLTLPVGRLGASPRGLRDQLAEIAGRIRGAEALTLRQRPIPHAYRVFFRHIGLEPDVTRVPVEALYVERLRSGGLPSTGLPGDALTLALVETGVPVWALDATTVEGALGVRVTREGEQLGREREAPSLPAGRIAVADDRGPLALLFGAIAGGHEARRTSTELTLFTVRVNGVTALHVEESLWICAEALRDRE